MCELLMSHIAEELHKIKPSLSAPLCEHFVFDKVVGAIEKAAQEEMSVKFSPTKFRHIVYAKVKRKHRPLTKHEANKVL